MGRNVGVGFSQSKDHKFWAHLSKINDMIDSFLNAVYEIVSCSVLVTQNIVINWESVSNVTLKDP